MKQMPSLGIRQSPKRRGAPSSASRKMSAAARWSCALPAPIMPTLRSRCRQKGVCRRTRTRSPLTRSRWTSSASRTSLARPFILVGRARRGAMHTKQRISPSAASGREIRQRWRAWHGSQRISQRSSASASIRTRRGNLAASSGSPCSTSISWMTAILPERRRRSSPILA